MYELQIHTTNNGIIRREAADLAEFDAIRAEWSGYSTTTAINVYEDGSEVPHLRYDPSDAEHEADFAAGLSARQFHRAARGCFERIAMCDEDYDYDAGEWRESKRRADMRQAITQAFVAEAVARLTYAPKLSAALTAIANKRESRGNLVIASGLSATEEGFAKAYPEIPADKVQLVYKSVLDLGYGIRDLDRPLYASEVTESFIAGMIENLSACLIGLASDSTWGSVSPEELRAMRDRTIAIFDSIR